MKRWQIVACRRIVAMVTSCTTLLMTLSPAISLAQDGDKDRERERDREVSKEKIPPPPSNPLVLINPADGSGNLSNQFNSKGVRRSNLQDDPKDFGNYQQDPTDRRVGKKTKDDLPLFGYNFFEPVRKFLLARRSYYQWLYQRDEMQGKTRTREDEEEAQPSDEEMQSDNEQDSNLPGKRKKTNGDTEKPGVRQEDKGKREIVPLPVGRADALRDKVKNGQTTKADRDDPRRRATDSDESEQTTGARRRSSTEDRTDRPDDERNLPGQVNRKLRSQSDTRDLTDEERLEQELERRPPVERRNGRNARANREEPDTAAISAFREMADPLSQFFRNVTASVPDTYQLAAGDKLEVRYQSPTMAERDFTATVDALGNLEIPRVTRIVVRGLTLDAAQKLIQNRLLRYFKNVEVTINLKELRTISVTVAGEAFEPGNYTMPAVATAFNLLFQAGGPTDEGSLRRIEVRRQGRLVGTLDFYRLMRGGGDNKATAPADIALQSGDILYIPPRESQVNILGEVRTQAIFEMIEGETLADGLRYAGGIKASGVKQSVQINTVDPGRSRVLKNVDIKNPTDADKHPLFDGDTVDVFSVREQIANKVTIEGAVDIPGDYALSGGMRLADLVELARGPREEAVLNQAELYRWNPDNTTTLIPVDLEKALTKDPQHNLELVRWDRVKVYTRQEVAWTGHRRVHVRGAVQRPGIYERSANMRVMDVLRQVGGPAPDAHLDKAVLLHQRGDGTFSYAYFSISEAQKGNKEHNLLIEDDDALLVYKGGEAQFTPDHVVHVKGAVQAPGVYPRGEGMKLSELISLSGGFLPNAGSSVVVAHARKIIDVPDSIQKKISIAFNSTGQCAPNDDMTLEDGDMITVQGTGGFVDQVQIINIQGAVNKPGPIVISSKEMRLSDAIREAGGLRKEAFPEGAEFFRNPQMLASAGQRSLAHKISELNNLINDSELKRERAKSDLARIQATAQASQDSQPLPLPGVGTTTTAPNPAAAALATELSKRELVTEPRKLTEKELEPNGAIAVNLPEALRKPKGNDDLLLVDGDTIIIPETPTTVQVIGAVNNGRGVLYKLGARLDYYVDQAGGYSVDVAKNNIVVIRANGGTIPSNKVGEIRPGDVILVPTRVLAAKLQAKGNTFDSVFRSITSSFLIFRLFGL